MPKQPREDGRSRPKRAKSASKRKPPAQRKKKTAKTQAESRPAIMPSQSVHHNTPLLPLKGVVYPVLGEPVDLDPCSNEDSIVHARRAVMLPEDGLAIPWKGTVFCNPPYGMPEILEWIKKCVLENRHNGAEIIALVPAYTSAEWFDVVAATARACFWWVPGPGSRRMHFRGASNHAPFHSCLIYWGPHVARFSRFALRYCHPWYPEHDLRLARAFCGDGRLPEGPACALAQAEEILTLARHDDLVAALASLGSATLGDILDAGHSSLVQRLRSLSAYELATALLLATRSDTKQWLEGRLPRVPRPVDERQLALLGATTPPEPPPPSIVLPPGSGRLDQLVFQAIHRGTLEQEPPTARELREKLVCTQGELRGVIARLQRSGMIRTEGRTRAARYLAVHEGNQDHATRQ